jgi:hypothetical protein
MAAKVASGMMIVDLGTKEVLLVKKVHEFVMRQRSLKKFADTRLNG